VAVASADSRGEIESGALLWGVEKTDLGEKEKNRRETSGMGRRNLRGKKTDRARSPCLRPVTGRQLNCINLLGQGLASINHTVCENSMEHYVIAHGNTTIDGVSKDEHGLGRSRDRTRNHSSADGLTKKQLNRQPPSCPATKQDNGRESNIESLGTWEGVDKMRPASGRRGARRVEVHLPRKAARLGKGS